MPDEMLTIALAQLAKARSFYQRKFKEIESQDDQARRNGMSYKNRVVFRRKLEALQNLLKKAEERRKTITSKDHRWIIEEEDMGMLSKLSLEGFIKFIYLPEYI